MQTPALTLGGFRNISLLETETTMRFLEAAIAGLDAAGLDAGRGSHAVFTKPSAKTTTKTV